MASRRSRTFRWSSRLRVISFVSRRSSMVVFALLGISIAHPLHAQSQSSGAGTPQRHQLVVRVFEGDPIADLRVAGARVRMERAGKTILVIETNGLGIVNHTLPEGDYRFTITHPEFEPRSYHVLVDMSLQLDATLVPFAQRADERLRLPSWPLMVPTIIAILIALVMVPRWQTRKIAAVDERLRQTNAARQTLATIIGAGLVIVGLTVNARQLVENSRFQSESFRADRISRYQERLEKHWESLDGLAAALTQGKPPQQLAALHRLRRLAVDSFLHPEVESILTAYVASPDISKGDRNPERDFAKEILEELGRDSSRP